MAAPTVTADLLNAAADAAAAKFNNGKMQIREGAGAGATNSATGTLLSEIDLPATAFAPASGGVASKNGTWEQAQANDDGTAGHFRLISADTNTVYEADVSDMAGNGKLKLITTAIAKDQKVTVLAFTLPAALK